jgi:electron transfer flavoprotein alpha subunit
MNGAQGAGPAPAPSGTRDVWVIAEHDGGQLAPVSLELVGKARELADQIGGSVAAVVCGYGVEAVTCDLVEHGADLVLLADHPELAVYRTLPYARVATELIRQRRPYIVLLGATPVGRDLAPRLASALRAGLTADCTALRIGDLDSRGKHYADLLYQIRPAFGGNVIATIVNPQMHPQMATVREGVMRLPARVHGRLGRVERVDVRLQPQDLALQILSRAMRVPDVDLAHAQIIVAGGAGVGSREGFELIRELARALGGQVAATRAAVDAGWISADHQVGQTGVTVRPRLYIAAGISGAAQHLVGMDQSAKVIAINTDPNAPIFRLAHYKIVGDLRRVIPQLIEAYRGQGR